MLDAYPCGGKVVVFRRLVWSCIRFERFEGRSRALPSSDDDIARVETARTLYAMLLQLTSQSYLQRTRWREATYDHQTDIAPVIDIRMYLRPAYLPDSSYVNTIVSYTFLCSAEGRFITSTHPPDKHVLRFGQARRYMHDARPMQRGDGDAAQL
ncbi:hypothetical protein BV25DRAFT_301901 [Artomyces pyxidatus]|uniref:Uncharacterized protein n=1 Tax=Artomyces pyxidatus TaxID=48021 RepID=A0ACB8T7Z3_9AGAM|nr:hypothetical protein BV25DRAFT_301901 [Artomyces pyxidatus]